MKWNRVFGWLFAVLGIFVLLAMVGGYFFVKSSAFNQFARRKIGEATQQASGAQTTIRSLDFSLSTLTAHLYGITLHGNENAAQPPLLTIDKLTVAVTIQSLLHHKLNLSQLIIEHPVANLRADSSGASNLPVAPPSQSSSPTNVFDLAVRHAQLINGETSYNDKEIPLEADLYNLNTDINFEPAATRYSGSISYDNGHVRYGEYAPLPHSVKAAFSATPAEFSIESAILRIGSSVASVRASLSNYGQPLITGDYDIRVNGQDVDAIAPSYKARGTVLLAGKVSYHYVPDAPMLRVMSVDGQIQSDTLSAITQAGSLSVAKLRGRYQLANGTLQAREIEFNALGGKLSATVAVQNLDATPSGSLQASLHGISLRELQRSLHEQIKQVAVSGTLNGTAEASWVGNLSKARVRSDLDVTAEANASAGGGNSSANPIPVEGAVHATYDGAKNIITLRKSTLRIPSATLAADGQISQRSNLQLQITASDLHQLESVASAFGASNSALPPISGSAALSATIHGSLAKPQIAAQLSAQNLDLQGTWWRRAQANLQASPSQVAITNGSLISAERGRASFSGTVALHDWHYQASSSFTANVSVQQMAIADLQHAANLNYPVSGDLSANVSLSGTQLNPQGSGKIEIANAQAYDEPVRILNAQFHTEDATIISSLHIAVPAGAAEADLSYTPKTNAYKVSLNAPSLVLQKLHTVQEKNLALTGTLTATASGQGTIENPQLSAVLQLPQLTLHEKSISGIKADLEVANRKADVTLSSNVVDSSVQARAHVNLAGSYETEASIETTEIPLDVLLATYLSSVPEGFKGLTELHATLNGPLKDKTRIEAHVTIPKLNASYQSLQIGIVSPVHADFVNSILTVQPAELRGTDTDLRVQGSLPLLGNAVPSLTAQGTLDLRIVKIFSPDTESSGTISFNVRATGTAKDPDVNGQVRLQDAAVLFSGAPLGLEKLNGTLDVGKDSVQVSQLSGKVGGGDFTAGGSIVYRPSLHANLALQGKSIRLLYPNGLRTLLDTNLTFSGDKNSSTLNGRVLIDSLSFTPDFDLSNFADQFSGDTSLPAQPGFADTIQLGISLQSKDNLSAHSSQISVEGNVNLRVIGTAADPVVTGRTDLTSGELFYRNVRYQLQRGIITFDNPNVTSPVLNVSATTTVEQYNLTLNLRGSFDKLTTSYTSDPPLATADIINLIARGQTTQESAASSQSTDSMIASEAVGQVTGSLQKLAGISSLEIDPLIGSQDPSARIALQQRVTKDLLFTFSTDVSQPGSEIVEGDYRINKRWSVSVTRDQVGGVSVDGRLHTRF